MVKIIQLQLIHKWLVMMNMIPLRQNSQKEDYVIVLLESPLLVNKGKRRLSKTSTILLPLTSTWMELPAQPNR